MMAFIRSSLSGALIGVAFLEWTGAAYGFDDKDCARIETVQQSYNLDLKSSDSVVAARDKITDEIVKRAIQQSIGYELHSNREQDTILTDTMAQEKFKDAEKAMLSGLVRVKVQDEKRVALPDGQTLTLTEEVKVCIPKPDAVLRADRMRGERLLHPPKAVDPATAIWFDPSSGEARIWFSRREGGEYAFFDNPGFDPQTGSALEPISTKTIHDWKVFQIKQKREAMVQAARAKQEAERRAFEEQTERAAAVRQADLSQHARENCDKYAANPNDSAKPRDVSGVTWDDLRASSDQAVESCEAAVQQDPKDMRLRYQLARAYSAGDPKRAIPIFKALCGEKYPAAFDNYGWTFLDRRVGLNNLPAAIAFFRVGARLGDSGSMVSLATFIQKGKADGSYPSEAVALLQRAAAMGNSDAAKALEPLLEAQRQQDLQRQQYQQQQQRDLQNAQAVMGLMGGFLGGMRR